MHYNGKDYTFAALSKKPGRFRIKEDSVAQLVEQYTFNVWVLGSSPSGITKLQQKLGLLSLSGSSNAEGLLSELMSGMWAKQKLDRLGSITRLYD